MRRWILAGVALLFAVATAVGLGLQTSNRQQPMITDWAGPGESRQARGMVFELIGFSVVDYEPDGISDPIPSGAVPVVAEIRQNVGEVPEDPYELSCEILLHNGANTWYPDIDMDIDLELESDCNRVDGEDVTPGQERTIKVGWVVPEAALRDARVAIRFYGNERAGIGFSVDG